MDNADTLQIIPLHTLYDISEKSGINLLNESSLQIIRNFLHECVNMSFHETLDIKETEK